MKLDRDLFPANMNMV
jgi:hypothetical protein